MKIKQSLWMAFVLLGFALLVLPKPPSSDMQVLNVDSINSYRIGLAAQTTSEIPADQETPPVATRIPTPTPIPEPPARIGSNFGLVCGASVLVMIIIGGVFLSSRQKRTEHQT